MSSCCLSQKQIDQADKFNDMALMEDPGYAKAHYRKCTILEAKGQFSAALNLAEQTIDEYSHEFEFDEMNKSMIPKFEEFVKKITPKLG